MTGLRQRLTRLTPSLTAKERFLLVLRNQNEGKPDDPTLRQTVPKEQRRAFNRYAHLTYVANAELGPMLAVVAYQVEGIEFAVERLRLLDAGAAQLDEIAPPPAALTEGHVSAPAFVRQLANELRTEVRKEVSLRWRELRASAMVWDEIAAEFDGEPVMRPKARALAAETEQRLRAVAEELAAPGRARLPEPSAAFVDGLRDWVRDAYQRLGWIDDIDAPTKGGKRP